MKDSSSTSYLIKGGKLYNPNSKGEKDLLISRGKILKVDSEIPKPEGLGFEIIDATGKLVIPGLVDLHVHVTGGGGESGPRSRVPEISLSDIIEAGVTTVAGVLGTDSVSRSLEDLLVKVKALDKTITALGYTGAYHLPSPTLTGSVKKDIALINEFVGVKCAISDHRSSQLTTEELARLASQARVGGMLGEAPGIVHVHVGNGANGLKPIFAVLEESEIPPAQFVPTHIGRSKELLKQGIKLIKQGGFIDVTCPSNPLEESEGIRSTVNTLLENDTSLNRVTLSSDSNGSMPQFDEEGNLTDMSRAEIGSLFNTFTGLIRDNILSLPNAVGLVTENPARRLGLFDCKGSIEEGKDADLVVLTEEMELDKVLAKGELLVEEGKTLARGPFE